MIILCRRVKMDIKSRITELGGNTITAELYDKVAQEIIEEVQNESKL